MVNAFIRHGDGRISRDASPDAISAALREESTRMWIDLEKASKDEISVILDKTFDFHPLAIEDTISHSQRPKIEHYTRGDDDDDSTSNASGSPPTAKEKNAEPADRAPVARTDTDAVGSGYCYLVFHGPDQESFRENLRTKEIDMFISSRYIVSIHDEPMKSVGEVRAVLEGDANSLLGRGTDILLYTLLDHIVDHYQPILDYLEEALSELEDEALENPRSEVLGRIAQKKRELLNLRRVVGPQREIVAMFSRGEVPFVRESVRVYFRDVQDHLVRTVEMIELYRDLVMGARDLYLSSISNYLNQIMKTLTIISVIGLPLTVITGFFGMNFEAIPGLHSKAGFWGAVTVMGVAVTLMLYFFRKKRWL
jgi:magnesium transporter